MGTISEQCFTNNGNYFKAFELIKFLVPLAFSIISQAVSQNGRNLCTVAVMLS